MAPSMRMQATDNNKGSESFSLQAMILLPDADCLY